CLMPDSIYCICGFGDAEERVHKSNSPANRTNRNNENGQLPQTLEWLAFRLNARNMGASSLQALFLRKDRDDEKNLYVRHGHGTGAVCDRRDGPDEHNRLDRRFGY